MQTVRVLVIDEKHQESVRLRDRFQEIPNANYIVEWVPGIEQALERLASPPAFDFCLMDIDSPAVDGGEALRSIARHEESLPVVLLTRRRDGGGEEPTGRLGSNTYLVKDQVDAVLLQQTLRDALHLKRFETELQVARDQERVMGAAIQEMLLLRRPPQNVEGIRFGAAFLPTQQVGGDYSEFIVFDESTVDVLVGDVMGKGIPAAIVAAETKCHFQRAIWRLGLEMARFRRLPEPEEILSAVHATLTPELIRMSSFVTLLYARFDLDHQRLTFVECGHPRPIHFQRATGNSAVLSGDNLPLGIRLDEQYRQKTVSFAAGDRFVFYTDGCTEAVGAGGQPFGETRLGELIGALREQDAPATATALEEAIRTHCPAPADDLTCLVVDIGYLYRPLQLGYRNFDMSCDPQELTGARRFIEAFCQDYCQGLMSENSRYHLELAVHEVVGNIIKHAYPTTAPGRILLEAVALENEVSIRVVDYGVPFPDYAEVPPPEFDGTRDNGFGLFLVAQGVDRQERSRDDMGRNIVTLTKRYDRSAAGVRA